MPPVTTIKADFSTYEECEGNELCVHATWLGHAGYLIQLPTASGTRGVRVVFDPIFSEYAFTSFLFNAIPRRLPPPCKIEDLPELDFVIISHDHYDHCDIRTLVTLWEISNSTDTRTAPLQFFVPLGVKDTLILGGIPDELVMEMDWWESIEYQLSFATHIKIVISCTPCQHSSGRGIFDQNRSLWSSWVVQSRTDNEIISSVYFAGDTGYRTATGVCPVFREIGESYGPFDLAMIPIWRGATLTFIAQLGYQLADETHQATMHASPEDAVLIARDVNARHALAMHFATWAGSELEAEEPLLRLVQARGRDWWEVGGFGAVNVGQSVTIPVDRYVMTP